MNDIIKINSLEAFGYHGIYEEEKKLGQKYYIDIQIILDKTFNQIKDNLNNTVDYSILIKNIKDYFLNNKRDLLETIGNELVFYMFKEFKNISEIKLEIHKPAYHLSVGFEGLSVCISRKINKAYIALGSNLGDRKENLNNSCKILNERGIYVVKRSTTIETKPYGNVEQDNFLNEVIEVSTILNPIELMEELLDIEKVLKRERNIRWGPRTIDLDIILYGMEIINEEKVIIPHYDMHNRDFVLGPLCELNKFSYNPRLGKFAYEMLNDLK